MKTYCFVLVILISFPFIPVLGQNPVIPESKDKKGHEITLPESSTEYSITSYKNIDFIKTNPLQLEASGVHPEIYISNNQRGVIIICTEGPSDAIRDFSNKMERNPSYYETLTRQDTIVFSKKGTGKKTLDFTKASSINNNYKNAFNYKVDPRTGVSWSKISRRQDRMKEDMFGRIAYDLIFVISKPQIK